MERGGEGRRGEGWDKDRWKCFSSSFPLPLIPFVQIWTRQEGWEKNKLFCFPFSSPFFLFIEVDRVKESSFLSPFLINISLLPGMCGQEMGVKYFNLCLPPLSPPTPTPTFPWPNKPLPPLDFFSLLNLPRLKKSKMVAKLFMKKWMQKYSHTAGY